MRKLAQGAEAIVYKDGNEVIKKRISKSYRLPQLDEALRKFRTRREAKVLGKLEEMNFPAPHLKSFSDKRMSIVMDFVPGEQLKDVLKGGDLELVPMMGKLVGELHSKNIIHGDLTTSNMIVRESKLSFIDFGLSSFSDRAEDKAVDLFLLERSLTSTHFEHPELFEMVLAGYKDVSKDARKVLDRLDIVRKRGRNKNKNTN